MDTTQTHPCIDRHHNGCRSNSKSRTIQTKHQHHCPLCAKNPAWFEQLFNSIEWAAVKLTWIERGPLQNISLSLCLFLDMQSSFTYFSHGINPDLATACQMYLPPGFAVFTNQFCANQTHPLALCVFITKGTDTKCGNLDWWVRQLQSFAQFNDSVLTKWRDWWESWVKWERVRFQCEIGMFPKRIVRRQKTSKKVPCSHRWKAT